MKKQTLNLITTGLLVVAMLVSVAGCSQAPAQPAAQTTDLSAKVDALQKDMDTQKKSINPGLGTVMLEYDTRFAKLWYCVQADNWDQAQYQLNEMPEIQETGEVTRPQYADALKGFEKGYLGPLTDAVKKKDKAAFTTAYDKAIDGCNACHASNKGGGIDSLKSVKITRPTAPPTVDVDYAGQK